VQTNENNSQARERFVYQKGTGIIRCIIQGDTPNTLDPTVPMEIYIREKRGKRLNAAIIAQYCDEKRQLNRNIFYPVISTSGPAIIEVNLGKTPFQFDLSSLDCKLI
jgi:hypothetical protein